MITHYIFLCSAYSIGKRICIDFCNNETEEEIKNIRNYITEKCGYNVPMSTHYIQTNSKDWKSVVEKDKFFENVKYGKIVQVLDVIDSAGSLISMLIIKVIK